MRFNAEEILQQTFQISMRGYNTDEVDTFMKVIGDDYTNLQKEIATLKKKLKEAEKEATKASGTEDSLTKATEIAEKAVDSAIANGKKKAELIIKEAHLNAEGILKEAQKDGDNIRAKAEATIGDLNTQIEQLKQLRTATCKDTLRIIDQLKDSLDKLSADKA